MLLFGKELGGLRTRHAFFGVKTQKIICGLVGWGGNWFGRGSRFGSRFNPLSQEKSMKRNALRVIVLGSFALVVVVVAAWQAQAQDAKTPYPNMAPLDQYLMERDAEKGLARNPAPELNSRDAHAKVPRTQGYGT